MSTECYRQEGSLNSGRKSVTNGLLINAINSKNLNLVKKYMDQGANLCEKWPNTNTSIFTKAVENGTYEIIEFLITKLGDWYEKFEDETTPLIAAIKYNQSLKVIQLLTNKLQNYVNKADKCGRTPLNEAITLHEDAVVECLIRLGGDVNQCDGHGKFPIFLALEKERLNVLKYLVSAKADLNKTDNEHDTVWNKAQKLNNPDIINYLEQKLLEQTNIKEDSVTITGQKPSETISKRIVVEKGVEATVLNNSINKKIKPETTKEKTKDLLQKINNDNLDIKGDTPLAKAIKSENLEDIKSLINSKVNPCEISNGLSPLQLAIQTKNLQIVEILMKTDAVYSLPTALFDAINLKNLEIIKLLIPKAQLNIHYKNGYTPLIKSIETKNLKIVQELVQNGADVNMSDKNGTHPLIVALKSNNSDIVSFLIKKGADIPKKDKIYFLKKYLKSGDMNMVQILVIDLKTITEMNFTCGYSLLTKLAELEQLEVIKFLIKQNNAFVNKKDGNNNCALAIAARKQNLPMATFLIESGADVNLAMKEVKEYANICEDFYIFLSTKKWEI